MIQILADSLSHEYLLKPHIALKTIIYKEPLEQWHLERMVLLFHFLPFLGLLLHVDGKVHKRKKVEIKYEYLPQVYKTSKMASHSKNYRSVDKK